MKYELNNKKINIPDAEIEKSMELLDITKDEAIQMWLEDEGYLDNEEQIELTKKAKENGIIHGINNKKSKKKPKTVVVSDEKQDLFNKMNEFLIKNFEKVEVLKKNKLFSIEINGKTFKIDLIQQREKKEGK